MAGRAAALRWVPREQQATSAAVDVCSHQALKCCCSAGVLPSQMVKRRRRLAAAATAMMTASGRQQLGKSRRTDGKDKSIGVLSSRAEAAAARDLGQRWVQLHRAGETATQEFGENC